MIAAILPQGNDSKEQILYIPVQVETLNKFITTLVDSSACYNVISLELYITLENVKLLQDSVPTNSITRHTKPFIGKVFMQLKVG